MNTIGFQASASEESPEQKQSVSKDETSLVVREGGVIRRNGADESELSFAVCLWGEEEGVRVGLHAPNGAKAMVGRLAMLLAHDEILRAMLTDACHTADLLAAAQGEE